MSQRKVLKSHNVRETLVPVKELRALREVRDIMARLINNGEVLILVADKTADKLIAACRRAGLDA